MKALAAFNLVIAAIVLSPAAWAQTRVMTDHAQTAAALQCLLDHQGNTCRQTFGGSAQRAAQFWLWWTPDKDFKFGHLKSSDYAGRESVNAYLTRFLSGRPADVYDVKFAHEELTFYIVPSDPDGKILYMRVRDGGPNDERTDLFAHGPG